MYCLRAASVACERAAAGGRPLYFSSEMRAEGIEKESTLELIARVIETEDCLEPFFQPQVCASCSLIVGAEALVRMRTADNSLLPPGKFLPLAEASGAIVKIDDIVMRKAAEIVRRWRSKASPFRLSCNASPLAFAEAGFAERILWGLERSRHVAVGFSA